MVQCEGNNSEDEVETISAGCRDWRIKQRAKRGERGGNSFFEMTRTKNHYNVCLSHAREKTARECTVYTPRPLQGNHHFLESKLLSKNDRPPNFGEATSIATFPFC